MNGIFNIPVIVRHIAEFTWWREISCVNRVCRDEFALVPIDVNSDLSVDKTIDMYRYRLVKSVICREATKLVDYAKLILSFPHAKKFALIRPNEMDFPRVNVYEQFDFDRGKWWFWLFLGVPC